MTPSRIVSAVARRLGLTITPPVRKLSDGRPHAYRFRPTVEALEDRSQPATFTWLGTVSDLANNPANWQVTNGTSQTGLPGAGDDVYFTSASSNNCVGLASSGSANSNAARAAGQGSSGGVSFDSINELTGYTGTVSLGQAITVNAFTLQSGLFSQQDSSTGAGDDLTVLGNFSWTGGTLNSSPVLANVNLDGGGSISPANAGTVSLGSTLNLNGTTSNPTTWLQNPGTLQLTNPNSSVFINADAAMTATTSTKGDIIGITSNQAGAQKVVIQAGAVLNVTGPGTYTNNLPFTNAGSFNITGTAQVTLSGANGVGYDYAQGNGSNLDIQNGSTLTASTGMSVTGGVVFLAMNSNLPANQQTATINVGKNGFNMSGGLILFSAPLDIDETLVYGGFTVNGDVNWTGGTYEPSVDYTTAGLANWWLVNGTLNSAKADIITPDNQRGKTPPANSNWVILQATTTAGVLPTVSQDNNKNQLALGTFVIPDGIQWKLTSS